MKRSKSQLVAAAFPIAAAAAMAIPLPASGAKFTSAQVTRAINDVRILLADQSSRPAEVGTTVSGNTAVATGQRSRSELTFPDDTLVRLGSNTVFSFQSGKREMDLQEGTMLFHSPKWRGRAEIKTAAVTAAITGTTAFFSFDKIRQLIKIIILEGKVKLWLNADRRKSVTLGAGEHLTLRADAADFPNPFVVDLGRMVKTSKILLMGELPGSGKIADAVAAQMRDKRRGNLLEVGLTQSRVHPSVRHQNVPLHDARNAIPLPMTEAPVVVLPPPPPPPPPPTSFSPPRSPSSPPTPPGDNSGPPGGGNELPPGFGGGNDNSGPPGAGNPPPQGFGAKNHRRKK